MNTLITILIAIMLGSYSLFLYFMNRNHAVAERAVLVFKIAGVLFILTVAYACI